MKYLYLLLIIGLVACNETTGPAQEKETARNCATLQEGDTAYFDNGQVVPYKEDSRVCGDFKIE